MMGRAFACGAAATFALNACVGCARPLPRHIWSGTHAALEVMAQRDAGIESLSATCRLRLLAAEGSVQLNGVLVVRPPQHFRLRAWKFSQAVLDITMNPDGLFVFSRRGRGDNAAPETRLTREALTQAVSLLPGFAGGGVWQVDDAPGAPVFSRSRPLPAGSGTLTCSIDKETLTTVGCYVRDDADAVRQRVDFHDYRVVGSVVWPMRLSGEGASGSFEVLFDRVEVNPELPQRAFVPPRRATKQP